MQFSEQKLNIFFTFVFIRVVKLGTFCGYQGRLLQIMKSKKPSVFCAVKGKIKKTKVG